MRDRTPPIPSTVSAGARTYLRDRRPEIQRPDDLAAWEAERQLSRDTWEPYGQVALERHVESFESQSLAGIPVAVITPKGYDATEDAKHGIYIHGGSYTMGSPLEGLPIAGAIARHMGMKVTAIRYRLAPEHPFPAGLEDCLAVYREMVRRRAPSSLAMFGDSAGGGMVLATLLSARDAGLALPAAVALLSPWSDLTKTGDSYTTLDGVDPDMAYEVNLEASAKAYAGEQDPTAPLLSPVNADYSAGFPPTLITSGTRDLFLSNCVRLHRVLKRAGVAAELNVWEGMWHDFEALPDLPEGQESLEEIAAFLSARLTG